MNTQHKPTYISLFSSAGVGCYGFKMAGFDCIATNELLERRLNIQRYNQKCKYPGGYICGDITQEQTKKLLYDQLELWKAKEHLSRVDVVIATPPCQGMSIANQKKTDTEIVRNSLVVESIKIIQKINPRFFVFENVPAFMKTICTDLDGTNKSIADAIERSLGQEYSYAARIINYTPSLRMAWVPTIKSASSSRMAASVARRAAAFIPPVSRATRIPKGESRRLRFSACWEARISVGASRAA